MNNTVETVKDIGDSIAYLTNGGDSNWWNPFSWRRRSGSGSRKDDSLTGRGSGLSMYDQSSYGDYDNMYEAGCGPLVSSWMTGVDPMTASGILKDQSLRYEDGATSYLGPEAVGNAVGMEMDTYLVGSGKRRSGKGSPMSMLIRNSDYPDGHFIGIDGFDSQGYSTIMNPLNINDRSRYHRDDLMSIAESVTVPRGRGKARRGGIPSGKGEEGSNDTWFSSIMGVANKVKSNFNNMFGLNDTNESSGTPGSPGTPGSNRGTVLHARANGELTKEVASKVELVKTREINNVQRNHQIQKVIDVETGYSFNIRSSANRERHMDFHTITAEDTAIMKMLYNGRWSWAPRRPVILITDKNRYIAASINGMPHGRPVVDMDHNNSFLNGLPSGEDTWGGAPGRRAHACLWFYDSHAPGSGTSQERPDHSHPAAKAHRDAALAAYATAQAIARGEITPPGSSSNGLVLGDDNRSKTWNFFANKGLSNAANAAISGTIMKETEATPFNPSMAQSSGGPGRGIFQWENGARNTDASRYNAMVAFAQSRGRPWNDLESQLEFAWQEMNADNIDRRFRAKMNWTPPSGQNYYRNNFTRRGIQPIPGGFEEFKTGDDVEYLAKAFDAVFTRSADYRFPDRLAKRVRFANESYEWANDNITSSESNNFNLGELDITEPSARGGKKSRSKDKNSNIIQPPEETFSTQQSRVSSSPRSQPSGYGPSEIIQSQESGQVIQLLTQMVSYLASITGNTDVSNGLLNILCKKDNIDVGLRQAMHRNAAEKSQTQLLPKPNTVNMGMLNRLVTGN